MKKRLLSILMCVSLCTAMMTGCGSNKDSSENSSSASEESTDAQSDGDTETEQSGYKIGFAMKTMDNPFFIALVDGVESQCKEQGWECTTLNAGMDTTKEAENLETFITKGMDLIFLDSVDPTACIPSINKAADAGIPLVNLDSGVGEGSKQVTTVYSDSYQNGRLMGKAYADSLSKDEEIIAIMISSLKGNVVCTQRRTGLYCGILESRLGCSEDEAWDLAEAFEQEVATAGSASNEEAKFTVRGQCWGDDVRSQALEVSEDMITANKDVTVILSDAGDNVLGGVAAVKNAGLTDVDHVCASDAYKEIYDLIKEGEVFGTGENSPAKVAIKGIEVAKQILVDGASWDSFGEVVQTEAIAVTAENVDELYDYGF